MLKSTRLVITSLLLVSLVTAVDLTLHQSSSGAILGRWSTTVFGLLIVALAATISTGVVLGWLLFGSEQAHIRVLRGISTLLAHPIAFWMNVGLTGLALILLWNLPTPIWRTLLRLLTLLILLISGGLISLGIAAREHPEVAVEKLYRFALIVMVILILAQLVIGILFVTGQAVKLDEGTRAFQSVQFIQGRYKPYQPDGMPTLYMPYEYYIQGVFQALLGPAFWVARVSSGILAVIGLVVLYKVIRRVGGSWVVLSTLVLVALSATMIRSWGIGFQYAATFLMFGIILWISDTPWPAWLRVASSMLLAVMVVLTRNTLVATPLAVLTFYVLSERPRDWLIGSLLGGIGSVLLILPFWPDILNMYRFQQNKYAYVYSSGIDVSLRSVYLDAIPTIGTLSVLIGAVLIVVFLAARNYRSGKWPGLSAWIKQNRAARLSLLLMIVNVLVILSTPLGASRCEGCLIHYFTFCAPLLAITLGLHLQEIWSGINSPLLKQPMFLGWGILMLLIINTGQRAISPWHYETPSLLFAVNQAQQDLSLHIEPDDHLLYMASWHLLVAMPDVHIYPELTWATYFYLPDSNTRRNDDAFFWWYTSDQVANWLAEDSTVVVLDENIFPKLSSDVITIMEEGLSQHFTLVDEIDTPDSLHAGTIKVYRRAD